MDTSGHLEAIQPILLPPHLPLEAGQGVDLLLVALETGDHRPPAPHLAPHTLHHLLQLDTPEALIVARVGHLANMVVMLVMQFDGGDSDSCYDGGKENDGDNVDDGGGWVALTSFKSCIW